ncbi:MAG: hypothetical protein HQK51_17965 [Oligoflexia bacterium]|nr:hypothetical protein [Oligoflexia bacterium]
MNNSSYYLIHVDGEQSGYSVAKVVNGVMVGLLPLKYTQLVLLDSSYINLDISYYEINMIVLKTNEVIFSYDITEYHSNNGRINSRSYFVSHDGRLIRVKDIAAVVVYE